MDERPWNGRRLHDITPPTTPLGPIDREDGAIGWRHQESVLQQSVSQPLRWLRETKPQSGCRAPGQRP
jgi:hypothetical protein